MNKFFGKWFPLIPIRLLYDVLYDLNHIKKHVRVYPSDDKVFKAFSSCDYDNLKVVMIGQDPYPQPGVATGLLFANGLDTKVVSPSLEIIRESAIDYTKPHKEDIFFDITLESWAKQGVLLLNSALTVEENKPNSHTMLWREFMVTFIEHLSMTNTGLIFVLFGSTASTFEPYINKTQNYVFKYNHPAYYARLEQKADYDVFKKINEILKTNNNTIINWYE